MRSISGNTRSPSHNKVTAKKRDDEENTEKNYVTQKLSTNIIINFNRPVIRLEQKSEDKTNF